jgi:hypothetical protein
MNMSESQAPRANAGIRANSKPELTQDRATATNWKADTSRAADSIQGGQL